MVWQKGQSGNPSGMSKEMAAGIAKVRNLRRFNRTMFDQRISDFMSYTREEIEDVKQDPKATGFDLMLAATILETWEKGCPTRMKLIWDRLVGPVKGDISLDLPETHIDTNDDDKKPELPEADVYVVEMSEHGKFKRQRPRLVEGSSES